MNSKSGVTASVRRATMVALAGLCVGAFDGASAWAVADTPSAEPLASAAPGASGDRVTFTVEDFAGRSLVRLALIDLRRTGQPAARDYKIASLLFSLAEELLPADADIVRRRVESEWNAQDEAGAIAATERLVRLDPTDTVAQLRLISHRIARLQTAEQRLEAYERFLGPAGRSLDASIRSRLALDASLLYRERGREDQFVEKLKQATALDSTNKDAALLASTYFRESVTDPVGRAELLSNLLFSDPLDPGIFLDLMRELAAGGAFNGASRMFRIAEGILERGGMNAGGEREVERLLLAWHVSGAKVVRTQLETTLARERHQAKRIADQQRISALPGEEIMNPDDVRLPRAAEMLLTMAAFGEGNESVLSQSLDNLELTVTKMESDARVAEKRPPELSEEQALAIARDARVDAALLRALTGVGMDRLNPLLEGLAPPLPEGDPRGGIISALRGAAGGKPDEAIAALASLGLGSEGSSTQPSEPELLATLARGRVLEQTGRAAEARAVYAQLVREAALTPSGAVAASFLSRDGSVASLFPKAADLERVAAGVPRWVEEIVSQPRTFVSVTTEAVQSSQDPLVPMLFRVRLRNMASAPMGLGTNRPLSSRFLLAPNLSVNQASSQRFARPEVLDLDRRLRLMPGETLEATVWAEPGLNGWLSETIASNVVRTRYRLVQGFVQSARGVIDPGPGCIQADMPNVVRSALREATLAPADLAAEIATTSELNAVRMAAAVRSLILGEQVSGRTVSGPERTLLADALAKRLSTLSVPARLALVSVVPHGAQAAEFAVFDAAALADPDPRVQLAALIARAGSAELEALGTLESSTDSRVKLAATLQRERLKDGATVFANAGPGLEPIVGEPGS